MSLFDMAEQLLGGQAQPQGGNANVVCEVLSMVNNHPGGLPALVQGFENGLGGVVNSWMASGAPNQPVSGAQVQNVLGGQQLQDLAAKLGVSPEVASGLAAQVLPGIIDHLTPNGQVPAGGSNLMELGEGLLKNFMK
jgi:uncharacterized protein YidB (DUF937 family)